VTLDRYRPSPTVRATTSGDGLVLLDIRGGLMFAANPIGARIWQLLEARRTSAEIAGQLASDYAIPIKTAERDVRSFVADLLTRGLLHQDASCS
jgi:hypothetical protein